MTPIVQWEYFTDSFTSRYPHLSGFDANYLNGYGHEGWDLVSHSAFPDSNLEYVYHAYIFKRPKQQ